jgi:hypothetical protein
MLQSVQAAPTGAPTVPAGTPDRSPAGPLGAPRHRRLPSRLRVFFLRHFRACGRVGLAAERTGISRSTLYRWRDVDEDFRDRWETIADQRRHMLEDRLMEIVQEGERTAVFHKGQQVGWRESHTARAAIALLGYLDRREKARRQELDRNDDDENSSRYDDDDGWESRASSRGWRAARARRTGNDDGAEEDSAPTPEPVSQPDLSSSSALASEPPPSDQEREWDAYVERTRAESLPAKAGGKKKRPRAGDASSRHIVPLAPAAPPVHPPASPSPDSTPGSAREAYFIEEARRIYAEMNGMNASSGPDMLEDDWKPYQ